MNNISFKKSDFYDLFLSYKENRLLEYLKSNNKYEYQIVNNKYIQLYLSDLEKNNKKYLVFPYEDKNLVITIKNHNNYD